MHGRPANVNKPWRTAPRQRERCALRPDSALRVPADIPPSLGNRVRRAGSQRSVHPQWQRSDVSRAQLISRPIKTNLDFRSKSRGLLGSYFALFSFFRSLCLFCFVLFLVAFRSLDLRRMFSPFISRLLFVVAVFCFKFKVEFSSRSNSTLYARISPQRLSELRRLWPSVP